MMTLIFVCVAENCLCTYRILSLALCWTLWSCALEYRNLALPNQTGDKRRITCDLMSWIDFAMGFISHAIQTWTYRDNKIKLTVSI